MKRLDQSWAGWKEGQVLRLGREPGWNPVHILHGHFGGEHGHTFRLSGRMELRSCQGSQAVG